MNLRPLLGLLCISTFIASSPAKAQPSPDEKLVEVRTVDTAYAPYKSRRGTHGFLFGLQYENYYPDAYVSMLDTATYSDMFANQPIEFMGLEFGYKFNFSLGSLAATYAYSSGSISDSISGDERSLELHRNAIRFTYIMDRLLPEPYVAPYFAFGVWDFGMVESNGAGDSFSGQSQMGTSITLGLLVQLNWMDPFTARDAYMSSGLENTYLDLFMVQHSNTTSEDDPTTRTAFDWGAGLRLEF